MSLLTEQEIDTEANKTLIPLQGLTHYMWQSYARAIEAAVIAKIKAQGAVAVITEMSICGIPSTQGIDWVKEAKLGETLYRISEGD